MNEDAVAVADAGGGQTGRRRAGVVGELGPSRDRLTADQAWSIGKARSGLEEDGREVGGRDQRSGSWMLT